jgi:dipeptidyl aminopeptidase/acylaminoacyl peptidase
MRGWPESEGMDDCGWQQSTDVVNVVKWLSTQANVDPERIGLLGQSQGGQVVLNAGALDSSIKAIVAYYPVTDIELWGKDTNLEPEAIDFIINVICAQGVTQRQRSPLYVAGDIEAPVLLMHGDKDERVPILHSELMLKALLENGKDATLFRAKNGKHRPFGGGWTNSQAVMLEFFSEKLKGNLVSE